MSASSFVRFCCLGFYWFHVRSPLTSCYSCSEFCPLLFCARVGASSVVRFCCSSVFRFCRSGFYRRWFHVRCCSRSEYCPQLSSARGGASFFSAYGGFLSVVGFCLVVSRYCFHVWCPLPSYRASSEYRPCFLCACAGVSNVRRFSLSGSCRPWCHALGLPLVGRRQRSLLLRARSPLFPCPCLLWACVGVSIALRFFLSGSSGSCRPWCHALSLPLVGRSHRSLLLRAR